MNFFQKLKQNKIEKEKEKIRAQELAAETLRIKNEQIEKEKKELAVKQAENLAKHQEYLKKLRIDNLVRIEKEKPLMKTSIVKIGEMNNYHDYTYLYYEVEVGDALTFSSETQHHDDNYEKEREAIVVSHDSGDIGEISNATMEKIEEYGYDYSNVIGIVNYVDTESEPQKIKVSIYPEHPSEDYRYIHTYVTGTKYNNEDGSSRQMFINDLTVKDKVILVSSLYNGKPAVEVYTISNKMIGYLPKELAVEICNKIKKNVIDSVIIDDIKEINGIKYVDVNIAISQ